MTKIGETMQTVPARFLIRFGRNGGRHGSLATDGRGSRWLDGEMNSRGL